MSYGFEINNPRGKWIVTLGGPIPTDEEGWQRVRRSEVLVRDALERLISEPPGVTAARIKKLEEKAEQITFLDLLDESVKRTKAETSDAAYLDMLFDMAGEYSPQAVAKYVGLPDDFLESLATGPAGKPEAWSHTIMAEIEATMYRILTWLVEDETSHSSSYRRLVQAIFEGYLGHKGWLQEAERAFASYLDQFKTWAVVNYPQSILAIIYRDLQSVKLSLTDGLIIFGDSVPPRSRNEWRQVRSIINSDEQYYRLIEAAVESLSCDLTEDLEKIAARFYEREREDEYYSYGKGKKDFTVKLGNRIDKDIVVERSIRKSEDKLIYALKRGGYRTPEIRNPVEALIGRSIKNPAIRKRFERVTRRINEELT